MGTAEDGRSEDGFDRATFFFYIADSTKVPLDNVNCTMGVYCLVVSQANYCIFSQNAQCPIANDQFPEQPLLNEVYIKTALSLKLLRYLRSR